METKCCTRCKKDKPLDAFHTRGDGTGRPRADCKACVSDAHKQWRKDHPDKARAKDQRTYERHREKRLEASAKWRRENPEKAKRSKRNWALKNLYGITSDEYDRLLAAQDNKCAICEGAPTGRHGTFVVDHCHVTGTRGMLLCNNCNLAIGMFGEDPDRIDRAAEYLRARQEKALGRVSERPYARFTT